MQVSCSASYYLPGTSAQVPWIQCTSFNVLCPRKSCPRQAEAWVPSLCCTTEQRPAKFPVLLPQGLDPEETAQKGLGCALSFWFQLLLYPFQVLGKSSESSQPQLLICPDCFSDSLPGNCMGEYFENVMSYSFTLWVLLSFDGYGFWTLFPQKIGELQG